MYIDMDRAVAQISAYLYTPLSNKDVPVDGLSPLCARSSTTTVMFRSGSRIFTGPTFKGLTLPEPILSLLFNWDQDMDK